MGILQNAGAAAGSFFSGTPSASGLAGQSLSLGTLATGANVAGDIFSGVSGYQQAKYAASVETNNAQAALQAGQTSEEESKLKTGFTTAAQKAAAASRGVNVNSGSPVAVEQSTQTIGALDAALIHYNAARQAFGEKAEVSLDERAAGNILSGSLMKAGASFVGGATSLSDKWLAYQLSGAQGNGSMTLPGAPNG